MKIICPDCGGKKEWKIPNSHSLDVYNTDGPVNHEIYKCMTCKGLGEISRLSFAIYKARGESAPPIML